MRSTYSFRVTSFFSKLIATSLEKKIKSELLKLQKDDREKYEEFFKAFGLQLKFGIYSDYGTHKDMLQDLILFYSNGPAANLRIFP